MGGAVRRADALANRGLSDAAGAWARRECLVPAGLSREDSLIDHQAHQRTGAEASVHIKALRDVVQVNSGTSKRASETTIRGW